MRYKTRVSFVPVKKRVSEHIHYGTSYFNFGICAKNHYTRLGRDRIEWSYCHICDNIVKALEKKRRHMEAKRRREKRQIPSFLHQEHEKFRKAKSDQNGETYSHNRNVSYNGNMQNHTIPSSKRHDSYDETISNRKLNISDEYDIDKEDSRKKLKDDIRGELKEEIKEELKDTLRNDVIREIRKDLKIRIYKEMKSLMKKQVTEVLDLFLPDNGSKSAKYYSEPASPKTGSYKDRYKSAQSDPSSPISPEKYNNDFISPPLSSPL